MSLKIEKVPEITKKIDAFKIFINRGEYYGKYDRKILVLSLKGYTDKQILDEIKCFPPYFKARRKILFDMFKENYLDKVKQKIIEEVNYQVWNKAIIENRVF
jgi:hypothetical protein|tara:strand:- start:162 stop:467 length:306 start_codon:yes stop_codon:yes gene_type:complete